MKIKILGSGGAIPTPRALCTCEVCTKAREVGKPFKRNSCSIYEETSNTLVDCPEDIGDSLNRENITNVKNLFITHSHPDHTFGLRVLLEANYDFLGRKAVNKIELYIPKKVYEVLKVRYPTITYLVDVIKVANLNLIEDGDEIDLGSVKVKVVGYDGKESETYAYLFKENDKKALLILCDSISFKREEEFKDLDLLMHETGLFSYETVSSEISFPDMVKRIKGMAPKRTLLIHIEEVELKAHGLEKLEQLEKENEDLNIKFGVDGQEVEL